MQMIQYSASCIKDGGQSRELCLLEPHCRMLGVHDVIPQVTIVQERASGGSKHGPSLTDKAEGVSVSAIIEAIWRDGFLQVLFLLLFE